MPPELLRVSVEKVQDEHIVTFNIEFMENLKHFFALPIEYAWVMLHDSTWNLYGIVQP